MKKRLLSLLLALVMLVGMIPMTSLTASAADYNVGGVKAVASKIQYNSGNRTYIPMFSSVTPVTTSGTNVTNAQGTAVQPLYKDFNGMSTLSNLLTTAPEDGVTYYSRITMNNPNGNANVKKDYVKIEIEGYKTEYLTYSTGDGGFTVHIFYSVTKKAPEVYVGGVGMYDGDYLAVGANKTTTTKPSGGYAYYKDGKLTLNNYSYTGEGYEQSTAYDLYAAVYSATDLTLNLVGSNTLVSTSEKSDSVYAEGVLTVGGSGSLTCTSNRYGLQADGDLTINSGTIVSTSGRSGIKGYYADVIINGGDITINSCTIDTASVEAGIYAYNADVVINGGNITTNGGTDRGISSGSGSVYINGGNVTAVASKYAIEYRGEFVVANGLKIRAATTENGALGEYVAANHDSYKKIVVRPAPDIYVGGVGMYDGDYLAVGATATQTTKPSGGYAYYKNGTLTLNNYSYEGKGYQYTSIGYYAVIYSKNNLTIELIGNNTLTQTDSGSNMIYVDGVKLTVGGNGKLTGTSRSYAIYAYGDLTINGGTIEVSTYYTSIISSGDVIIKGGDITAKSEDRAAIYSKYDVTVNGGNVTATGGNWAIDYSTGFTVPDSMKIQASTTVDGELGEYVAANHKSYKKITIHSHDFGTAWKYKEADGHAHVCSFCGEHDTVIKHTPNISAPTEKQDQKCTVCGYVIAPSLGHIHKDNLTKVTAKPATCTSDGNSEYYSCSCGKYFKDASASTEIKDKNSVIIKASHSFGTDWGYQDENGHAHICVCAAHDELIPHTPGAEATETTPQKCTECGYIITPALNHVHNLTKVSAKPATCTEEGNAEFYICDGCSYWFEDAEGNVKIEDKASVNLIATGHAFGDEFKTDENEHWYECACGEKKDVAAHNDENNDGKCDACGYSSASAETEPAVTESKPAETTAPDDTDDENKGGMPWWAILLIVIAAIGISVGVTVIVLKKKK